MPATDTAVTEEATPTRPVIEPGELRELISENSSLKGVYEELGWRVHQQHELQATVDQLTAKSTEARREYDKSIARLCLKYKTPPGTKFSLSTGEIFLPGDPEYANLH